MNSPSPRSSSTATPTAVRSSRHRRSGPATPLARHGEAGRPALALPLTLALALAAGALGQTRTTPQPPADPDAGGAAAPRPPVTAVTVFEDAAIFYNEDLTNPVPDGPLVRTDNGQALLHTLDLPDPPSNQRDARRIVLSVEVQPVITKTDAGPTPADIWPRLGAITVLLPGTEPDDPPRRLELMRFVTGFGGPGLFQADVTPFAPVLFGRRTIEAKIDTYNEPGWRLTARLRYDPAGRGARRPVYATPVLFGEEITAAQPTVRGIVEIPEGLAQVRLRIMTTGHATDGAAGDEFTPRAHVIRVDGLEIARFWPWSETGGVNRRVNPTSGRRVVDGREVWSSDFDRAGWAPGELVRPVTIPLLGLQPGRHEVEVTIQGIRPRVTPEAGMGYWRTSVALVADEPWPWPEAAAAADEPGSDGSP